MALDTLESTHAATPAASKLEATLQPASFASQKPQLNVSVIVPCYNTERFLNQALTSLEQNDMLSIEFLVFNDGSTDNSLAIMNAHAKKDARIRVIDKPNEGYGATVNRGLAMARGRYIAILEPDDWEDAHMYDELYALAVRYDYPDIVKSAFWCVHNPDTKSEYTTPCSYYKKLCITHQPFVLADYPRILEHHPSIWSCMYNAEFLRAHDLRFMEEKGGGWVDTPFNFKALCLACSIVYTDTPFYHYRSELAGSSSALRSFDLPFIRWNNMYTIARDLHITDEGILQGLYTIGFNYIEDAISRGALQLCHDKILCLMNGVYACMDPRIVARMPYISRAAKERFALCTNASNVHYSSKQLYAALSRDALRQLSCYGIAHVARGIRRFAGHRFARRRHHS